MSEDQIHVISTSTIKADSTATINLTPLDLELLFLEYTQMGLLFLNPTPLQESAIIAKSNSTSLIDHLKASLERALHVFPPLAGRLATTASDDGTATCFSLECTDGGGGVLFIHATTKGENQLTVARILNSSYIIQSLFPLNGVHNYDGILRPLLAVQVTELADGLFIGWSANHLVGDATSYWHFFNSWTEISSGNDTITKLPFLNRDRINLDSIGSTSIYISDQILLDNYNKITESPPLLLCDQIFHISKESTAKLKERANQETADGKIISSLQAIVAHVWVSIVRCRFATDLNSEETTFDIPMGARQRLNPPLPEQYFGNAVLPGVLTLKSRDLLQNGPGWVARQINEMLASKDKVMREFCARWVKNPVFLEFEGLPSNYFILINSPRFDVYGNDFGWGKPVAVRSGRGSSFDGRITVSPGLEEGSMEIEACLTPETMSKLREDAEFMCYFVMSKL